MITKSLSRRELQRFENEFMGSRQRLYQIAIAPRRFEAMLDIEAVMWLQMGAELGIFPAEDAAEIFKRHRDRLMASLRYAERAKVSKFFPGDAKVFLRRLGDEGVPFIPEGTQRLSSNLFDPELVLMLLHEVGHCFRDGELTMTITFSSAGTFRKYVEQKCNPDVILRGKNVKGLNLLIFQYLGFLGHAAGLKSLWDYLGSVRESSYAVTALRDRVRSIHNWRLDLHDQDVHEKFDQLTRIVMNGVSEDATLVEVAFDARELLSQIEALCESWCGDDNLSRTADEPGGTARQVKDGRESTPREALDKKRPAKAA